MIGPENASPDPGGAGRVFKWGTRSTKEFELHAFANDLRAMTAIIITTTTCYKPDQSIFYSVYSLFRKT